MALITDIKINHFHYLLLQHWPLHLKGVKVKFIA